MAATSFPLYASYSQLCVFLSSLQQPFNDWQQAHVDQGFAWRSGSASFRTLEEEGEHLIELAVSKQAVAVSEAAVRVIEVPFDIPSDGDIEIASISDSTPISLPPGKYMLRCELFEMNEDGAFPVRLTFIASTSDEFKVVRADDALSPPAELLTDAAPAV